MIRIPLISKKGFSPVMQMRCLRMKKRKGSCINSNEKPRSWDAAGLYNKNLIHFRNNNLIVIVQQEKSHCDLQNLIVKVI